MKRLISCESRIGNIKRFLKKHRNNQKRHIYAIKDIAPILIGSAEARHACTLYIFRSLTAMRISCIIQISPHVKGVFP